MANCNYLDELFASGSYNECLQACQLLLEENPDELFAYKVSGKTLLALGQFEQAISNLKIALQLDRHDPEIAKDLGNCYRNAGMQHEAVIAYQQALVIDPSYAPAIHNLAGISQQNGKYDEALCLYIQAYTHDPTLYQAAIGASQCAIALGSWDTAINYSDQALAIYPNHPGVKLTQGISYHKKGELIHALAAYQSEIETNPSASDAYVNTALIHLDQGRLQDCVTILTQLLEIQPANEAASLLLAQVYQKLRKWDLAIKYYEEIAYSDDIDAIVPFNLGVCLLELKRTQDAYHAFMQATRIDSHFVQAWGNIGNCLRESGECQKALDIYDYLLAIDPYNVKALTACADIKQQAGMTDEAIHLLTRASEITPKDYDVLVNLSFLLLNAGRFKKARQATDQAIIVNPNRSDAYVNLAAILKEQGSLHQAYENIQKAIRIDSGCVNAHMILAGILRDQGDLDSANDVLNQAIELDPNHPDAYLALGAVLKEKGLFQQATAATMKAIALRPEHSDAFMNLGSILHEQGNLESARLATIKAIELQPDHVEALTNLGIILKDQGNIEQAHVAISKALELRPSSAQALYVLGCIKRSCGDLKGGDVCFRQSLRVNPFEIGALQELSNNLETIDQARMVLSHAEVIDQKKLAPRDRYILDLIFSNCFHRLQDYSASASYLTKGNRQKLCLYPSDAEQRISLIEAFTNLDLSLPAGSAHAVDKMIFIVGMPRCGSTLLETVLSLTPNILCLGETEAMALSIEEAQRTKSLSLESLYLARVAGNMTRHSYIVDKQLYNFCFAGIIASNLPSSKIIHCIRNPMDNILSMFRTNLTTGNNYTSSIRDAANVLLAQEKAMRLYQDRYNACIYRFDYDHFVSNPKDALQPLLQWLNLDWNDNYLHPENSSSTVLTSSVVQARKPINRSSVGGWLNYRELLQPAVEILTNSEVFTDMFER